MLARRRRDKSHDSSHGERALAYFSHFLLSAVWDQLVLLIQVAGWRFDYFNSSSPIALPIINTSAFLITIVLTFLHCTLGVRIFSLTSVLIIYIVSFFLYALTFPIILGACDGKIKRLGELMPEHL